MTYWKLQVITGLLISILLLLYFALTVNSRGTKDFCQDYIAATRFIQGQEIYAPLHCHDANTDYTLRYNMHPPFSVLLYLPLTFLSMEKAALVWTITSIVLYTIAGIIILNELKLRSLFGVVLFLFASTFWPQFQAAIYTQNLHIVLLLILVLSWKCYTSKRYELCAMLLGFATLIKIWPVAFVIGLLLLGKTRAGITGFITILSGILISSILFGPTVYLDYLNIPSGYEEIWILNNGNISFVSFLTKTLMWYSLPAHTAVLISEAIAIILALTILAMFYYKTQANEKAREYILFCLLPTVMSLLVPIMWEGGLVILLLPCVILFTRFRQTNYQPTKYFLLFTAGIFFGMGIVKYVIILQLYLSKTMIIPSLSAFIMFCTMFFLFVQVISFRKTLHPIHNEKPLMNIPKRFLLLLHESKK